jgi:porphobilinogen synthase
MIERPRRLRKTRLVRDLVHEVDLRLANLIQPYFVTEGATSKAPIKNFTNVFRWGIDLLSVQMEKDLERGVKSFLLFGDTPSDRKDAVGSQAFDPKGIVPETLRVLRQRFGQNALLFADVCLCPYSSQGHCGVLNEANVENDPSLKYLGKSALCFAEAGADFVAPSDMMDGRIGFIRDLLDEKGFADTGILAYTAKYSSAYYGPFREALDSNPRGGSRAAYQMDYRNQTEALRELRLDLAEGADIVMVKPALSYLDIISRFSEQSDVPVAAYSVSGEYEMVKQMAASGLVDERSLAIENLTAIRRAGAQLVITYFASQMAEQRWLT